MKEQEFTAEQVDDALLELADDLADDLFEWLQGANLADLDSMIEEIADPELSAAFNQLKATGDLTGIDRGASQRSDSASEALRAFISAAQKSKAPAIDHRLRLRFGDPFKPN